MPNNPETLQDSTPKDPASQGARPEYPQDPIAAPGLDSEMTPTADHGEESYRGLGRLNDRVALITGGDSGIGRAVALAFAREGADVIISYLPTEEPDAEETSHWIEQAGRRIFETFLAVASGAQTKSEAQGFGDNEFVPWQIGAVM